MSPLRRTLVEKAGHDHGFEYVLTSSGNTVVMGSARHPARVDVALSPRGFVVQVVQGPSTLLPEVARSFDDWCREGEAFVADSEASLALFLQRTALLAQSLPNQAVIDFEKQVAHALAELPPSEMQSTEVRRLVRQRLGQDRYRQALVAYWGAACAVTGLSLQPALRASHAKPWADCATDAERLDVFNGFLLSANLDALFDKFLISFSETGKLLVSPSISAADVHVLGLSGQLALRWISAMHQPYLQHHRERFKQPRSEALAAVDVSKV